MKWSNEDLKKYLPEFKDLYSIRPILNNEGGMKSAHMFPAWFIIKKLKPKFLIESGIWKGLGTWFFEKASPDTKIFSIDPNLNFRIYISDTVQYQSQDFLQTDWRSILEPSETLVFFDDHQNCMPRIKRCKELGFNKIIFEDNYPSNQGDCYTPKKIFANKDYVIDRAGVRTWIKKNKDDLEFLKSNVSLYQEMPPIFSSHKTRWGDNWDESYPTPEPLLEESDMLDYIEFYSEKLDYTWIAYMELK